MIEAAAPKDEIEAALVIQMAGTHSAAMAILSKLDSGFGTEQRIAAFGSAAARLLRAYATQVEVLRRLHHGGHQYMRIEHVHISDGGQAVIGNLKRANTQDWFRRDVNPRMAAVDGLARLRARQAESAIPAPEPRLCRRGEGCRQTGRVDRRGKLQSLRNRGVAGQSIWAERPRSTGADEACPGITGRCRSAAMATPTATTSSSLVAPNANRVVSQLRVKRFTSAMSGVCLLYPQQRPNSGR